MASDLKAALQELQPLASLARAELESASISRELAESWQAQGSVALAWASQYHQQLESLQALFTSHESDLRRVALGLVEEMTRVAQAVELPLTNLMRQAQEWSAQFVLPSVQLSAAVRDMVKLFDERTQLSLTSAMAELTTPWLRVGHELQSVQGFAALYGLGQHVTDPGRVFSEETTAALREQLGDWREAITMPVDILELPVRTRHYEAHGFNPLLTDFPQPAFRQVLKIAQLDADPPDVILVRKYRIPAASDQEDAGFRRTNWAHDLLQRFETHLRRFIDAQMQQVFGESWMRHQLDADTRKRWTEKRQIALDHGEPTRGLIEFADFTDYERVLRRGDNWKRVFAAFFGSSESVGESLRRLYPIRLATMHARPISQDDEVLLHVEVKRILLAIGVLMD